MKENKLIQTIITSYVLGFIRPMGGLNTLISIHNKKEFQ